jgi:hypothetical protein
MVNCDDFDRALAWARGLQRWQFSSDIWEQYFLATSESRYVKYTILRNFDSWSPRCVDDSRGFTTHEREFKTFSEAKSWLIAMILTGH